MIAEIKLPIQVNLPDDWLEQIVNRLKNDPEAEWVEIIRCKNCKYRTPFRGSCKLLTEKYRQSTFVDDNGFCSMAERRINE